MLLDVIRTDPRHVTAYVSLQPGEQPGDPEHNAIARWLGDCDADDLWLTATPIQDGADAVNAAEYTLWDAVTDEQACLWRLRGHIGDVPA